MKPKYWTYEGNESGYKVHSHSKITAWAMFRNKCIEMGLEIPTLDKIKEL